MIARGDAIGGAAIGDTGRRVFPTEWQGPALPLTATKVRPHHRRFVARR